MTYIRLPPACHFIGKSLTLRNLQINIFAISSISILGPGTWRRAGQMIKRLWVGGLFAALAAASSFGQTVTETFEAGIPASWTIHDNFPIPGSPDFSAVPWTVNTVEAMLNYTNGLGLAATASSHNHSGQYDISLLTPIFKINSGAGGNSLQYTINYDRVDAFEAFDTDLSINGGPWIVMTHDTTSLGPAYSGGPPKITRTIDLGFFGATVGDSAQVEFRYYSTFLLPMVKNEYVQIDDVRTPIIPEPTTLSLLPLGLAILATRHRRA
jgi:hypothetical protein